MNKLIYAKKLGMTQIISEDGQLVAVSVLQAINGQFIREKSIEKDGYKAAVLGFDSTQKSNKPHQGQFKKEKLEINRFITELKIDSDQKIDEIVFNINQFSVGDKLKVRSKSIGKGFAGTIKRWGFARGPETHGSKNKRLPGSIGAGTYPGRVMPGKKMSGRMGHKYVTLNSKIIKIDEDKNLLFLSSTIPGKKETLVRIEG